MSNDFYNVTGTPTQVSNLTSPPIRSEFAAIAAGFDKQPTLTGNAYKIIYVNASGTALAAVGGSGLLKLSTTGTPTIASAGTDYVVSVEASVTAASAAAVADTDNVPFVQTSVAGALKKITWANVKANLKTYFDTLYSTAATVASYVSGLIGSTLMGYVAPGTTGNILTSNGSAWTSAASAATSASPVRQTVLGGPVDTSGYPSFLPATAVGLSITAQNISATFPFVATAAAGFGSSGAVDRAGKTTSNSLTWDSLTNTATNYLYVDVATDGTLSTGSTTLAPIYNFGGNTGGAPYTTSGQNVYNIQEGKMYVGPTPTQVYRVFVGEAVTSGGNVASTVAYAYQGRYESGWTATLPQGVGTVSFNHNLGIQQDVADIWIECTTNDGPFVVGDRIRNPAQTSSSIYPLPTIGAARNSMKWYSGSGNHLVPTSASFTLLTAANWKYKATAQRGW